jgi:hypothetical protein
LAENRQPNSKHIPFPSAIGHKILVFPGAWGDTLPERLKNAITLERNGKPDPQGAKLVQENQQPKELVSNFSVEKLILREYYKTSS